jgi:hypothetical protein
LDNEQLSRSISRHGDALLAARTGPVSGFFVLDIDFDPQKGIDGFGWLNKQLTQRGLFPVGPVATTRRQGRHYYFQYPGGQIINNSTGKLARDVDIRGTVAT